MAHIMDTERRAPNSSSMFEAAVADGQRSRSSYNRSDRWCRPHLFPSVTVCGFGFGGWALWVRM